MKNVILTDVCDFQGGTQPPKNFWRKSNASGYVRMLQIRDFTQPEKDYIEYVKDTNNTKKCNEDDILIGRYGASIGKICTGLAGAYNVALIKTIPNKSLLDKRFLFYILKSLNFQKFIQSIGSRAAQAGFNKEDLSNFLIPLPPLDEQKRIAAILDAADLHRQKTKALLDKYDELAQALFLDMFGDPVTNPKGWEKEPFEYFAKFDTRMVNNFEDYLDYPHIGIGNIEKDSGKILGYNLVKDEDLKSGKYLFDSRHIIYSKIRPNLNKVAIPDFKGLCSADSYPILVNGQHTNRIFFSSLLRSKDFIEFILGHSTRTNIPKANKAQMRLYYGIAPNIKLQNEFEKHIFLIESQKSQAEKSLQKAEELFQSLLQKAFKGEL
ncbi:MAG: restriction endonuclease subunit S [Leadbetterella sp.]|nr:restriction endonuclease subunit S [Leadbetterella sp.]